MVELFTRFEKIARSISNFGVRNIRSEDAHLHPFDQRNVHPKIVAISKNLFDDGHYSQATFEAFKFVDNVVSKLSSVNKSGFKLMMEVFNEVNPKIHLTKLSNQSEIDEQKGFCFLFAGSVMGIRNPRGHLVGNLDTIDECLDYLCVASLLLRRVDARHSP